MLKLDTIRKKKKGLSTKHIFGTETPFLKAQTLCESRGGRPGLPENSPCDLCGRKAVNSELEETPGLRIQELCESRVGRPGLPVPKNKKTTTRKSL